MLALHIAAGIGHIDVDHRLVGGFQLTFDQAVVDQEVAHAALADGQAGRGRGAAAAEFGGDEGLALGLHRGVVEPSGVELEHHHRVGRAEGYRTAQAGTLLLQIVEAMGGSEGHDIQGAATGVQVERDVAHRHQHAGEVVGDLAGHAAVGVAGEAAVEVATVQRRGALAGFRRRHVHHRHDDHPPVHITRLQTVGEFHQCGDALVLVTMVAAGEQRRRPFAVGDHGDRDHHRTPGGLVHRDRQLEKTVLHALGVEVDAGADRTGTQGCGHANSPH